MVPEVVEGLCATHEGWKWRKGVATASSQKLAGLVKESGVVDRCYELGEHGWVEGERGAVMFCRKSLLSLAFLPFFIIIAYYLLVLHPENHNTHTNTNIHTPLARSF